MDKTKSKNKSNTVVIVGRINIGKSTLFNRLSNRVRSISLDYQGVTRDFLKDTVVWKDTKFQLIDSGGIDLGKTEDILFEKVRQQVLNLLNSSDVILFMTDGKEGVINQDIEIAKFLHKFNKPVVVVVNKIDTNKAKDNLFEFYKLGYEQIVPISAEHGIGINDLLDVIVQDLPNKTFTQEKKSAFKVTFIGKPNVGKSSLMNALLKEERSIVSDIPGTTREALTQKVLFYQDAIELTDTAGLRRMRAIKGEVEPLMAKSSLEALRTADIVVLLIDGTESNLVDQELKLAFYAFQEQYKALILVVNKTDIMTDLNIQDLEYSFKEYKFLLKKIPVLEISCKTSKNVGKLLPLIKKIWGRYSKKFDDAELAQLLITGIQKKPLYHKGEMLKIYRVQQIGTSPITIELVVNVPDWFKSSQISYFENLMRSNYDIKGVPIKFVVKKKRRSKAK